MLDNNKKAAPRKQRESTIKAAVWKQYPKPAWKKAVGKQHIKIWKQQESNSSKNESKAEAADQKVKAIMGAAS